MFITNPKRLQIEEPQIHPPTPGGMEFPHHHPHPHLVTPPPHFMFGMGHPHAPPPHFPFHPSPFHHPMMGHHPMMPPPLSGLAPNLLPAHFDPSIITPPISVDLLQQQQQIPTTTTSEYIEDIQQPPQQQEQPQIQPQRSILSSSAPITTVTATTEFEQSLVDIFYDLASRFVINIPQEELESFERLLFQIEAAYWFYDDFYREERPSLPKYSLAEFTKAFFYHCPLLKDHQNSVEEILKKFSEYKTRVPVFGAIILNQDLDKALFVKGFGNSHSWGFPKGKVNKDEPDADCAIREVLEETGFDSTPYLNERHYIELIIKEQKIKLYIIAGVPEDTYFSPRTRKEISKIEWIPIDELPVTFTKKSPKDRNFYRALPFFNKLKKWITIRKAKFTKEFYPTTPHQSGGHFNNNNNNNNSNFTPKPNVRNNSFNNFNTPSTTTTTPSSLNNSNVLSLSTPTSNYSPYPISPPVSPREVNTPLSTSSSRLQSTLLSSSTPSPIGPTRTNSSLPRSNSGKVQFRSNQQQQQQQQQQQDNSSVNLTNMFNNVSTTKPTTGTVPQQILKRRPTTNQQQKDSGTNILSNILQQHQQEPIISVYPPIPSNFTNFRFTVDPINIEELSSCFQRQ
eukprot:gene5949-7409_t